MGQSGPVFSTSACCCAAFLLLEPMKVFDNMESVQISYVLLLFVLLLLQDKKSTAQNTLQGKAMAGGKHLHPSAYPCHFQVLLIVHVKMT